MAAGPFSDSTLWIANTDQVVLRNLEDVTLAFHKASGDTHILNFLSAAIIKVLAEQPETVASVAPKVIAEIGVDKSDCPPGLIKQTLLQLDDVGLVAPQELST